MSRPQGVQAGGSAGNRVDAALCAHTGTTVERTFSLADLPRLREAGAHEGTAATVNFSFSLVEKRVAIDGRLEGVAVLTCQRCLKPLQVPLRDEFNVILVREESELDQEFGGYEPVLADPARLDVQSLAEDQVLLALPLVPRHESQQCNETKSIEAEPQAGEGETQRPFGNLRDLMRRD